MSSSNLLIIFFQYSFGILFQMNNTFLDKDGNKKLDISTDVEIIQNINFSKIK